MKAVQREQENYHPIKSPLAEKLLQHTFIPFFSKPERANKNPD